MNHSRKEDIEANRFAIELLMPKKFIVSELEKIRKGKNIGRDGIIIRMSKKFKVSQTVMESRLYELGFITQL